MYIAGVASASAISPFVHGGLDDLSPGSWTVTTKPTELLVSPLGYGPTFYAGGGITLDFKKFRQKRIVPTLSLDTDCGATYFTGKWNNEELGSREQTYFQFLALEELMLRVKIPAGSRLVTPFVGIGGGLAVVSSSISRPEGEPGAEQGYYEGSATVVRPAYAVPFGLEITLSPRHTIYWRFGPVVPIGSVDFEYETGLSGGRAREKVSSEIPNSFVVLFGYRGGQ
jgi:hypothetical protein